MSYTPTRQRQNLNSKLPIVIAVKGNSGSGKDFFSLMLSLAKKFKRFKKLNHCSIEKANEILEELIHKHIDDDTYGQAWNWKILRFADPLRIFVNVINADDPFKNLNSQESKLYKANHLDQNTRDLHLDISDAIKEKLNRPDIFATLLKIRLEKLLSSDFGLTYLIKDLRYRDEVETLLDLETRGLIRLVLVSVNSVKKNIINHLSEKDLELADPKLFDINYENSREQSLLESYQKIEKYITDFKF